MSREIKFRAWHEGNKSFCYGTIKSIWMNGWNCCEALESPKLPKEKDGIFTTQEALKNYSAFEPNANWERYTGLHDKNGKEIFEGDIVKCKNYNSWEEAEIETVKDMVEFRQSITYEFGGTSESPDGLAIIGNIHQNPELLKSK